VEALPVVEKRLGQDAPSCGSHRESAVQRKTRDFFSKGQFAPTGRKFLQEFNGYFRQPIARSNPHRSASKSLILQNKISHVVFSRHFRGLVAAIARVSH
jgi:hypothetical protein